ncbi:glycosyltransferase family 2 protein [Rhodospirillum sp. A1_3_36]|uniref:glycosyltransferase family 2 protein n=1 Tax=Rhodospirillum sp. A1_3_36 TaxID=3391666 RepID=UPI0039A677C8
MAVDISVITPAYQTQAYLTACLASLESEVDEIAEVIVIDDGSEPPLTIEASDRLKAKLVSLRLEENQGASAARNLGVARASGDWVSFLDSDDECLPGRFRSIRAFIDDNPEVGLFGGEFLVMSDTGEKYGHLDLKTPEELLFESLLTCPFLMSTLSVRTDLARFTPFDSVYKVVQDYVFMVACLWKSPGAVLKSPLARRRERPESLINSHPDRQADYLNAVHDNFARLGIPVEEQTIPGLALLVTNENGFLNWVRQDPRHLQGAMTFIERLFSALDALSNSLPYGDHKGLQKIERRLISLAETIVIPMPAATSPKA